MKLWPTRDVHLFDPVGWDDEAQRVHDVTPTPAGLLHHSTCWCRRREAS